MFHFQLPYAKFIHIRTYSTYRQDNLGLLSSFLLICTDSPTDTYTLTIWRSFLWTQNNTILLSTFHINCTLMVFVNIHSYAYTDINWFQSVKKTSRDLYTSGDFFSYNKEKKFKLLENCKIQKKIGNFRMIGLKNLIISILSIMYEA